MESKSLVSLVNGTWSVLKERGSSLLSSLFKPKFIGCEAAN